jgi:hypothetical protein
MKKRIFPWAVKTVLASGIIVGAVAIAQEQHENAAAIESAGKQWLGPNEQG